MNEKDRHEQLRAILSLSVLPLMKDTRRKLNTLFLLNLLGTALLIMLGLIILVFTLEV